MQLFAWRASRDVSPIRQMGSDSCVHPAHGNDGQCPDYPHAGQPGHHRKGQVRRHHRSLRRSAPRHHGNPTNKICDEGRRGCAKRSGARCDAVLGDCDFTRMMITGDGLIGRTAVLALLYAVIICAAPAVTQAQQWLGSLGTKLEELPPLPAEPDHLYAAPPSGPVRLVHRGLPLDLIEDPLPKSSAYRQASAVLFAQQADVTGRPLTPLHGGHVGLLCTAGMLNGIFGNGESLHIAHWQSVKLVDKSEEEEDGKTIIREKERFSNELTLVFCSGEIATLK